MITTGRTVISLALATLLSLNAAFAALLSSTENDAAKDRIGADYKEGKADCAKSHGNVNDVCIERVKGKEPVAAAELEYQYSGKPSDANNLAMARANSAFAVSNELRDEMTGRAKDLCRAEANATHVKARADTTLNEKIDVALQEAATDRRSADYKVAVAEAIGLSSDAMSVGINTAKTNFNKI